MWDEAAPSPLEDREKPLHDWFNDSEQYRLKVQRFRNVPPEVTVQRISFERECKRYLNAYESGQSNAFPRRKARLPSADRDEESIERSQRRAKTRLRLAVTELAPNHFTTFTTRETGPVYFSPDEYASIWARFVLLMRNYGYDFEYVAVLERHPENPRHLHLHVAWRGAAHYGVMRRLWHIAICAHRGLKVEKALRGADSPGNIQDRPVKAARGSFKAVRKIARYMSKYLTKDLIAEFNKKRYWPSKGINVASAEAYWLGALSMSDAIREACQLVGEWDHAANAPGQKLFNPSDRVCWFAVDPDRTPPPF